MDKIVKRIEELFQSTPPRREVTPVYLPLLASAVISIHTSPKGGDPFGGGRAHLDMISIHTSPKGGDITPAYR